MNLPRGTVSAVLGTLAAGWLVYKAPYFALLGDPMTRTTAGFILAPGFLLAALAVATIRR